MDNSLPPDAVPVDDNGLPTASSVSVGQSDTQDLSPVWVKKGSSNLTLPDGRVITFTPPSMSLQKIIKRILKDDEPYCDDKRNALEEMRVKSLLYISHIDGSPRTMIQDSIARAALEQELTDEFVDGVFGKWAEIYLNQVDLEVTKKF